jgi:hypothetical protein
VNRCWREEFRTQNRQIGRLLALEDAIDIRGAELPDDIRPIGDQAPARRQFRDVTSFSRP